MTKPKEDIEEAIEVYGMRGHVRGIDTSKWKKYAKLYLDPYNPGALTDIKPKCTDEYGVDIGERYNGES